MRRPCPNHAHCWMIVAAIGICLSLASVAPAQQPSPQAATADLEKRIRELEETVRRLQSDRFSLAPGTVLPAEAGTQATDATKGMPGEASGTSTPGQPKSCEKMGTGPLPSADGGCLFPFFSFPPGPLSAEKMGPGSGHPFETLGKAADGPVPVPIFSPGPSADEGHGAKTWFTAGWDNGFILRSADDDFRLRITGQIQADYRAFLDENDFANTDQFFLRRARFGLEATLFRYYDFRFMPDFGLGKAVIQDAYMNIHYWEALQFEAGKFKQPFSYEQLIQDRFVPLVERSLIDQLVPARDVGVMLHGENLLENRFEWAVSVSNGEINGNGDTNDRKDFNARVAVRPFNSPEFSPLLQGWLFGIAVTTGIEQEPINPNTLTTPAGVPWFAFNSTVQANGLRNRWSPEIAYFDGPLGLAAQYFEQDQKMQPALSGPTSKYIINIPFEGFYVMGTLLLTGETRTTYSQEVTPILPFDPRLASFGPGAWELVARVSRLDVNEAVFAKGPTRLADPGKYSSGATEMTLGFNWYLNAWFRTQFNWEHAWFDDPVTLGPPPQGIHSQSDALMTRFQVIF